MPRTETHSIYWRCMRCDERGTLPSIDGEPLLRYRDAIIRGHERRSPKCDEKFGIKHVHAVQDGKTFRFGPTSSPPASEPAAQELR